LFFVVGGAVAAILDVYAGIDMKAEVFKLFQVCGLFAYFYFF